MAFIWSGPDQWLVCSYRAPAEGMEAMLGGPFRGLAAVVDQSHGKTLFRITGPRIRDAFAKGCAIDLHPRVFQGRHTAMTAIAHVGVHMWQIDERPTYEVCVPRSHALSFWHWLEASAAEFGLELIGAAESPPADRSGLLGLPIAR